MQFLRQNTAVIVTVGPFLDKTDGVTLKTALTITNEHISFHADTDAGSAPTNVLDNIVGATSGTNNDLNYITGQDDAMMQLELAAADTNRVGRCLLTITDAANHVPVFQEFFILPQAIFDWFTGVIVPLPANITQLLGTAWLTPGTAGTPDVNTKLVGGTTQTAGDIIGDTNDIQARLPAALVGGKMDSTTQIVNGTSDSGTTTTMVDAARTEADDDYWKDAYILFTSGTISGQCRLVTGFTASSDTMTFAPATTQAVSTQTYLIIPNGRVDIHSVLGSVLNALISGRLDANTQAMANDVITAAVIATDAIGSSEFAQGAADKVWATTIRALSTTPGVKKNTALSAFEFFMRDSADHVSGKTGLTVVEEVSIDGGAFTALTNTFAEVANGIYKIDLAAADVNGNVITLKFTATGADPTLITIVTDR